MAHSGPDGLPALFRAGDIGVSSEWRDITYDWTPILTADGVFIYSYLRDMFDNQRMLRPFILDPDGPTKQRIQRILGRRTGWAIQGPEYLLATVGLVHAEVQYGSSGDLERPHHTAVAYYVVGRLDHPVLNWTMLERVLDALIVALEPPSADVVRATRQKDAQAALRSLGHAGMLQNIDPEDIFDPDGAWPSLLPTLIQDQRWTQLFAHLHSNAALQPYRQQARAWIEWTQRRAARLMQENRAIADQLLAAQRRAPRGGGPHGATPQSHGSVPSSAESNNLGTRAESATDVSAAALAHAHVDRPVSERLRVNRSPNVPGESLTSPQGVGVSEGPSGTDPRFPHEHWVIEQQPGVPGESLLRNQIHVSCWSREVSIHTGNARDNVQSIGTDDHHALETDLSRSSLGLIVPPAVQEPEATPLVAPHLRDEELATTRQDGHFWQAIQHVLYGDHQRYAYTEGEKKAAYRLFKRTETPVGVVLAALRAVVSLRGEQCPQRFGDALKLPVFHRCVQQALALIQSRTSDEAAATWPQFLQSYRSIGHASSLRDVSVPEYHVLKSLFEHQPEACWEVLQRAEQAAQPPQLSVAYLRRAITNNQQVAALRAMQPSERKTPCRRVPGKERGRRVPESRVPESRVPEQQPDESLALDPRRELLEREGVNPALLTAAMTVEHIQAWIVEADLRHAEIKDRAAWLAWGIRSGLPPREHPKLPPSPGLTNPASGGAAQNEPPICSLANAAVNGGDPAHQESPDIWKIALSSLRQHLPFAEFETWIKETSLIQVAEQQAIVGTPNIFARDKLAETYVPLIAGTLQTILGFPVQVAVVLDSRLAHCR